MSKRRGRRGTEGAGASRGQDGEADILHTAQAIVSKLGAESRAQWKHAVHTISVVTNVSSH